MGWQSFSDGETEKMVYMMVNTSIESRGCCDKPNKPPNALDRPMMGRVSPPS